MFDSILNALKSLWDWVVAYLKEAVNFWLEPLADKLPDLSYDLSFLSDELAFANTWVALDWVFYLIGCYCAFIVIMILIKLVVKLFIPTVG